MDLDLSPILSKLELILRAQVLIAEEHYTAFGNEKCQFVFLSIVKVLELQANDLGTDMGRQVLDFLCSAEESSLLRVCTTSRVCVFAVVVADGVDILEI